MLKDSAWFILKQGACATWVTLAEVAVLKKMRTLTATAAGLVGVCAIATNACATPTVDQNNSAHGFLPNVFGAITLDPLGQTFTAGASGALTSIDLNLSTDLGLVSSPVLHLYTTSGGLPVCELTSTSIVQSSLPTITYPNNSVVLPSTFTNIAFSTPAQVTQGTKYAFVLTGTGSLSDSQSLGTHYEMSGYAGGEVVRSFDNARTWQSLPAELPFVTYVDSANSSGVSQCSGGGNAGGESATVDDSIWFQSMGRASSSDECPAEYTPSWAQWPNGGTGGFVCNRSEYAFHPADAVRNVFFGTWLTN